jgi:hypothetical protein
VSGSSGADFSVVAAEVSPDAGMKRSRPRVEASCTVPEKTYSRLS